MQRSPKHKIPKRSCHTRRICAPLLVITPLVTLHALRAQNGKIKCGKEAACKRFGDTGLDQGGQHDKAVACLVQAWAVYQELGNDVGRAEAALELGQARLSLAQAEHHHAAPDTTSAGGVSAACADTLQEAEAWLQTALDMAVAHLTRNPETQRRP